QQGILVKRTEDTYSFSHLTFQEYLTAQYLIDNNKWKSLIRQHLTNEHWREILLLIPGLITGRAGADRFLLSIEKKSQSYLKSKGLRELIVWLESHTKIDGKSETIKRKATVILIVFELLTMFYFQVSTAQSIKDIQLLENIDEIRLAEDKSSEVSRGFGQMCGIVGRLTTALDEGISKKIVRSFEESFSSDGAFTLKLSINRAHVYSRLEVIENIDFDNLIRTLELLQAEAVDNNTNIFQDKKFLANWYSAWFHEFKMEAETARIFMEAYEDIVLYLYICELMIRCKEGAVRVSPNVWAGIESRILTVPAASEATEN
ncbi:MAG: hypothetical protein WBA76_14035, partial [Phormidesmis sp.]